MLIPMLGARYERESWPAAGGAGEQDAWLTAALEYLRLVYNAMLNEEAGRQKRTQSGQRRKRG